MSKQKELPEMPDLPAEGNHALTFTATFKNAKMGMKSEAAMMEMQFAAFAQGLDHEAIANLIGKSVTVRVCSSDFARRLSWLGKEEGDRQRRAETTHKEDAKVAESLAGVTIEKYGDYLNGDGNRWTVKAIDGGFKIEPDGEFDVSGVDRNLDIFIDEDVAWGMLKVWAEKRGYKPVPRVGWGTAYASKAKGAGIIRLAWNGVNDAFQPFFFATDEAHEERGFVEKIKGDINAVDAQKALDEHAKKHELEVAGYYDLSLIMPTWIEEVAEEPDFSAIAFKDDNATYSVDRSPSGTDEEAKHEEEAAEEAAQPLEPSDEEAGDQAEDSGESEAEPAPEKETIEPTEDAEDKPEETAAPKPEEEEDPFAEVPEHPESPNAATKSADGEKTTIEKLQAAFADGAKRGGPKIQIKDEFKVAGSRSGPINVFEVLEGGKAADVMGKGPIAAEIINREWDFVE